jgi:GNAT superfamily N-acetyltransferase
MVMASWEPDGEPRATAIAGPEQLTCEIRVLETLGELVESYRLRYGVYAHLGYLQHDNDSDLEIDGYDARAIPFGAFDAISGAMIGTLRLITAERQPDYDRAIQRIVAACADDALSSHVFGPLPWGLPSIVSEVVERQIERFNADQLPVLELSRTIVRPGHRGKGVSRGLMELGLAHATRRGPAMVIGGCLPSHLPMYARFGCQPVPQTVPERFDSVGQVANTVICRTDLLPQPTRGHVDALVGAMTTGALECTLEIGRDSRARYRLATLRRAERRTHES